MSSESFAILKGRQAVVTGASSGIGRAIAREFAAAGADVLLHYAHDERTPSIQQLAAELTPSGRHALPICLKFNADTDYAPFVNRCWSLFPQLDIWVNNAGVDLLTGPESHLSYHEKLQRLYDVDVRSTMLLTKLVGQRMKAQGRGVILNIGWDQADRGMEGDSAELFSAAKNAIMGATRSFAVSFAPEVRVNCIAPGWIQTAWGRRASDVWQERVVRETPLRRWGQPEDVARLARFLASDDANYLTGQVININGGAVR
jgi:3-oxoacyl-[acyl-carrier protein] reductase